VSIFQYHTKLCFKCSIWLLPSLNLTAICWRIEPSCSVLLSQWHPWIKNQVHVLDHLISGYPKQLKYFTFSLRFWSLTIFAGSGYLEILLSKIEQKKIGSLNYCLNQRENLEGCRFEVSMQEKHCRDAISSIPRLFHMFWVNNVYNCYRVKEKLN